MKPFLSYLVTFAAILTGMSLIVLTSADGRAAGLFLVVAGLVAAMLVATPNEEARSEEKLSKD